MYELKKEFEGSHLTLPGKLKKFGMYLVLSQKTKQNILKALFDLGHPAVVKKEKNDPAK